MYEKIILPKKPGMGIDVELASDEVAIATMTGLVKTANEDRVGYLRTSDSMRLCLSDGHWGGDAAERATEYWLDRDLAFPSTRREAVVAALGLERLLYERYRKPDMDENVDFTPETAFVAVEIGMRAVRIVSYGDCRLKVVHGNGAGELAVQYDMPMYPTWMGVFSALGMRSRMPASDVLVYKALAVDQRDTLLMYSDGIDECVYETPTVSDDELVASIGGLPGDTVEALMRKALSYGAEDNASIAVATFGR